MYESLYLFTGPGLGAGHIPGPGLDPGPKPGLGPAGPGPGPCPGLGTSQIHGLKMKNRKSSGWPISKSVDWSKSE